MKQSDLSNPVALAKIIAASNSNNIPVNATGSSYASQTEGFPEITMIPEEQGGEAPHGKDFNGFLRILTSHMFNIQNGTPETFNPEVSNLIGGYPKNAQLWLINSTTSRLLKSTKDDNTDNFLTTPSVIGTSWIDAFPTKDYVDSQDTNLQSQITKNANNIATKANNNAVVHIAGTETITGTKTFSQNILLTNNAQTYRHIYSNNSTVTKGTAPSAITGMDYMLRDSANSNIAAFSSWYNTNGNINIALSAYTPTQGSTTHADLRVGNYASGRADVVFETPTGVANSCLDGETNSTTSNMVALKGWVNNPATSTNVVHRTGNETIGGVKRFSENILTNINATRNVAPSTTQYGGIGIRDNANNLFASMVAAMDTNKNASAFLRVYNPKNTSTSDATYMTLHYNADGSTFVTAPASDVNTSIVTTVNKSKAANGYFQLGNGLIMQWGKSTASSSSGNVTLPKAFSSTNYAVVINDVMANVPSSQGSNANVVGWGVVSTRKTTSFTAFLCNYENSYWWKCGWEGRTFTWIAIGY